MAVWGLLNLIRRILLGLSFCWNIRGVTQVMRHHNWGIQRCEIESCDWMRVVASLRLNNCSSFKLLSVISINSLGWDNEVHSLSLSVDLWSNLDLLSSREQERNRHSSDSRHLCEVEKTHELFQKSEGQIRILNTVDSKPSSRELIFILKVRDDGVGNIFFLLVQKVVRNVVKRIRSQFVISDDNLHHINLHTALKVGVFALSHSKSFNVWGLVPHFGDGVLQSG